MPVARNAPGLSRDFIAFLPLVNRIGVAVSGGGDSIALLHLLIEAVDGPAPEIRVASVDHGLRDGSVAECATVAKTCARLGIAHETLRWDRDAAASGNLQAQAREARFALLADWARRHDIGQVALGHTLDDQAETVLMRLARGAGVDGLSGIPAQVSRGGVQFLRPMLHLRRHDLRDWLLGRGIGWTDDPSNDDPAFDRVRVRQALDVLGPLGVTPEALSAVAGNMADARRALDRDLRATAARIVAVQGGDLLIARAGFVDLAREQARRLAVAALRYVSGAATGPRRSEQEEIVAAMRLARKATLSGCIVTADGAEIRVAREPAATVETVAAPDTLWDGRWRIDGPFAPGRTIRALGEGIRDCPDWRATGLPRASLMASPAAWQGDTLLAAPVAGLENGWTARIVADFHLWLESH